MENNINFVDKFKDFRRGLKKLKEGYYDGFSVSSGAPHISNQFDSSSSGNVVEDYINQAKHDFIEDNQDLIMKRAQELMEKDAEELENVREI